MMNTKILLFQRFRTIVLAGIFFLNFSLYSQTLKTSVSDGNWESITWTPVGVPEVADDVTINSSVNIPLGTTVEVQNLHLGSNGLLQVDGNLIVYGNVTMANNSPEFSMGGSAVVVIHGNFEASNKINISVSSYLIIYGDFVKDGSFNQGDLEADEGNIYIFGEVDTDWGMTTCTEGYDGTTETTGDSECDYGQQEDFEDNQDLIPDELKVLVSCFKISKIPNVSTCEFTDATFEVDLVENVTYEWQLKTQDGIWTPTGDNSNILSLSNVTSNMSGHQYRVILRPTEGNTGNCKVAFSNITTLTVDKSDFSPGPVSGEKNICLPAAGELTYSIPDLGDDFSYEWILPAGWNFTDPNSNNTPSITVLPQYISGQKVVKVIASNSCGQKESELLVSMAAAGEWTGYNSSDWNSPANWGCGVIPDLTTNVSIPAGLNNYPDMNSGPPAMVNDIEIAANASLTVTNFELQVKGTILNEGNLNVLSGSITFSGNDQQEISTGTFESNRIKDLKLNNPEGLLISGPLELTGVVHAENGNIHSSGNLKLISNATQTALVDGSGAGEIFGDVFMQRHLDVAYGYKYISSPFKNSTVGDFSSFMDLADPVTGFPHFYSYDESRQSNGEDASGWVIANDPGTALNPGFGYAVNFGNNSASKLVELSGEVNNGQIDINLPNNNGAYTKGFHLLGNPYPSPIDWEQVTRSNVEDAIYFFTAGNTNQYTGVYTSVVAGVSSDGSSSTVIPSMQGFFVKVLDGMTGAISFQNSARVNDFSQDFYKSPRSAKDAPAPLVRLRAGFDKELTDALVVYFPNNGRSGFEKDKDAQKLFNTDPNVPSFYSIIENEQKLSINALPASERAIPLGIKAARTGKMIISLQTANIEDPVYLQDLETGQFTNLSEKGSYRFQIDTGEHNDRFQLFFSHENLDQTKEASVSPLNVFIREGAVLVDIKLDHTEDGILQVTNMNGQVLQSRVVKGEKRIELNDFPVSGVYIVSLLTNGQRFSKKIILHK